MLAPKVTGGWPPAGERTRGYEASCNSIEVMDQDAEQVPVLVGIHEAARRDVLAGSIQKLRAEPHTRATPLPRATENK